MAFKNLSYSKLTKMKPNTRKFYNANVQFFKVDKNVPVLKNIGFNRKTHYEGFKKMLTPSEVFTIAENESKYINEVKKRDYRLLTGDYLNVHSKSYISNYMSSLRAMTIDPNVIKFLDEHPDVILEGLLPEIDNFYLYIKGKKKSKNGKTYTVNLDEATNYENVIKAVIKEFYKDKYEEYVNKYGKEF